MSGMSSKMAQTGLQVSTVAPRDLQSKHLKLHAARYIRHFGSSPLYAKMLTAGVSSALQEITASWLANPPDKANKILTPLVRNVALHGLLVKAPISQAFAAVLQRLFKGSTGTRAKFFSFLQIVPLQNAIFLASIAVLYGARTLDQIRAVVQVSLPLILKITWIASPLALAFAQAFLPEQSRPVFFNILAFLVGTCISTVMKKKRLAALKKQHYRDEKKIPKDEP